MKEDSASDRCESHKQKVCFSSQSSPFSKKKRQRDTYYFLEITVRYTRLTPRSLNIVFIYQCFLTYDAGLQNQTFITFPVNINQWLSESMESEQQGMALFTKGSSNTVTGSRRPLTSLPLQYIASTITYYFKLCNIEN